MPDIETLRHRVEAERDQRPARRPGGLRVREGASDQFITDAGALKVALAATRADFTTLKEWWA